MHSTCKTYTSNKLPNLNYAYLFMPVSCVHLQAVTFGMSFWGKKNSELLIGSFPTLDLGINALNIFQVYF